MVCISIRLILIHTTDSVVELAGVRSDTKRATLSSLSILFSLKVLSLKTLKNMILNYEGGEVVEKSNFALRGGRRGW